MLSKVEAVSLARDPNCKNKLKVDCGSASGLLVWRDNLYAYVTVKSHRGIQPFPEFIDTKEKALSIVRLVLHAHKNAIGIYADALDRDKTKIRAQIKPNE